MAYQAIARKYRPQSFDEVVGQEHLTRTIRNAIRDNRLHHAYLFSGARGVGKTTMARLLAKALNCVKGPTTEPCGACPSCREICESGATFDVQEIDAASHTGVENVRDVIINSVAISPARDRYRIFIIDEVHRLSKNAFDALLKTIEEPPPRVVFVLATTAIHEVPVTILSRCQHFEFKQISTEKIRQRLIEIAEKEGIEAESEAVWMIARAAAGSMRDGQSAFDQVISFAGKKIAQADVAEVLGLVSEEALLRFGDAIDKADVRELLHLAGDLVLRGLELRNFCRELMGLFRDLLVLKVAGDLALVETSEANRATLSELSGRFSEQELVRIFHMLARVEQDVKYSDDQRFALEIGLAKVAQTRDLVPLESLADRLSAIEDRLAGKTRPDVARQGDSAARREIRERPLPPPPASSPKASPRPVSAAAEHESSTQLPTAVSSDTQRENVLSRIIEAVETEKRILISVALEKATAARIERDEIVIGFPPSAEGAQHALEAEAARRELLAVCRKLFANLAAVRFETTDAAREGDTVTGILQGHDAEQRARSHPAVQQLLEKFGGEIAGVRPPSETEDS